MEESEEDIREGRVYSIDEVIKEFDDRYKNDQTYNINE